jgi:hypothetical protein
VISNTANHVKEEDKPLWTNQPEKYIAIQAVFNMRAVAPQRPNESMSAYVPQVQNAVATTNREAILNAANHVKEEDEPLWTDRTEKYIAAQAVFDARAAARPWTNAEKESIAARNLEYGREQQQAAMYKCRRIMTNVVTFEKVRKGLSNPLMRTVAAKITGECTLTNIVKEKLTQIEKVNQAKPKPTKKKKEQKGKGNKGQTNTVDKQTTQPNPGEVGTRLSCSRCRKLRQSLTRDPTRIPRHLMGRRGNNANGHAERQGAPRANTGGQNPARHTNRQGATRANTGGQNPARINVNKCSYTNCTINNCNNNGGTGINRHQKDFVNGGW